MERKSLEKLEEIILNIDPEDVKKYLMMQINLINMIIMIINIEIKIPTQVI